MLPELTENSLETVVMFTVSTMELANTTKQLDPNESPGYGLITQETLKELPRVALSPLCELLRPFRD